MSVIFLTSTDSQLACAGSDIDLIRKLFEV